MNGARARAPMDKDAWDGGNAMKNEYWGACVLLAAMACGPKTMHDVGDLETGGKSAAGGSAGTTGDGGGLGAVAGAGGSVLGGSNGTAGTGAGGEVTRHDWPP